MKHILITIALLLYFPVFSQNTSSLDEYRYKYVEIIGEERLSSNLTAATCPVCTKDVKSLSDTEILSILYNNALSFYGVKGLQSELQKKMYKQSDEFRQKNAAFTALRAMVLSKQFMVKKSFGGHYNVENRKFECVIGTISDYNDRMHRLNLGSV